MSIATEPRVIPIWPNGAPGTESWTQREQEGLLGDKQTKVVRNVTRPTLTAYLPEPSVASGTGVVVCPGGAFHFLAIEHEGTDVATWLVERGIAAFILRYRVAPTREADEEFQAQLRERFANREAMREQMAQVRRFGIADGQQAMKVAREHAGEWRVAPDRIGIMGFSAGGTVAASVALQHDAESRPAFAAPIYSAPWEDVAVPADAPALFMALANDDDMAVRTSIPLYSKWREAGHPVELHIFSKGGHGFGMRRQGVPADRWIDLFGEWLKVLGL